MYVRLSPKLIVATALALSLSSPAYAAGKHGAGHGHAGGGHGKGASIGEPGKVSEATRIVEIVMTDNRFAPERITVRKGATIRFVRRNEGEFVHEFNIGTARMHVAHRAEMLVMVENGALEVDRINHERMRMGADDGHAMKHDDANSKLLEPGKSAEMVWKFGAGTSLEFACNVPGHYEAGMKGNIRVR